MRIRYFSAVVIALVCVSAHGGTTCYQWKASASSVSGSFVADAQGAVTSLVAACMASNTTKGTCEAAAAGSPCPTASLNAGTCFIDSFAATASVGTFPAFNAAGTMAGHYAAGGTFSFAWTPSITQQSNPNGCPQCMPSGSSRGSVVPTGISVGTVVCGSDNCEYKVSSPAVNMLLKGGYQPVASVDSTGQACGSSSSSNAAPAAANSECQSAAGVIACLSNPAGSDKGCGTYNGDYVCPKSLTGGCVAYASGGVACVATSTGSTTATPPGPNNGTPGTPATPDMQVTYDNRTVNYYNHATVNTSSVGSTITPAGSANPLGDVSGNTPSAANGDCGATGVDCSASGDADLPAAGDDPGTFESITTSLLSGIRASNLYTTIAGISDSVPSGTCPAASFTVWGHSYDFMTSGCALWADHVAPVLSVVMLICFGLAGVFIVLSA